MTVSTINALSVTHVKPAQAYVQQAVQTHIDKQVVIELTRFKSYLDGKVRPGTVRLYVYAVGKWFIHLQCLNGSVNVLSKADRLHAQAYVDMMKNEHKSPSTVCTHAHAIMRYFKWKGKVVELECPSITFGDPEYLSLADVKRLIAACRTPLERAIVIVLFDTAIRINELLTLESEDIDRDMGMITVTRKGGKRDAVNISERAMGALDEWISARKSKTTHVFDNMRYWDAWNMVKQIGIRAGLKVHPHMLRHSRAIHMLMNGAKLHDVQQALGHRSITTTADIYGRFKAIDLKDRIPAW